MTKSGLTRSLFWLLFLSTACSKTPGKSSKAYEFSPTCSLIATAEPVEPKFTDPATQQAVQDFKRQQGNPYALLYIEKWGGAPDQSRCLRVVQRANNLFALFTYEGQQIDSIAITSPQLALAFAQVGLGNFTGVCDNYATEQGLGVFLVKNKRGVSFSLNLSLRERAGFSGNDRALVDSAFGLVRHATTK